MSTPTVSVAVSELTGSALDWAVSFVHEPEHTLSQIVNMPFLVEGQRYSSDWSWGGPIIEREGISVRQVKDSTWRADYSSPVLKADSSAYAYLQRSGPTALVAAMRTFVVKTYGEWVDIPTELVVA